MGLGGGPAVEYAPPGARPATPSFRLLEAGDGLRLLVVDLEDEGELRDDEDALDLLVHRAELELRVALRVIGVPRDQDAEGYAVHEGRLPQVDEQLAVASLGELLDLPLQLVGLLAAQEHSLGGEDGD